MTYTVVWSKNAENELLQIWTDSADRGSITRAANAIDPTLRFDPILRGETYKLSTRVLEIWPLLALYRVFEQDRLVKVISIQPVPPKPDEV
jgi:hypothetical protein